MPQPTRFSYASISNALPSTIRDHLESITRNAESSNARGEMAGVLVYGNNFFFHCLEAPASTIDKVYQGAVSNPLDEQFKLLKREAISKYYFTGWEIKYFIREEALQQFFHQHYDQANFNPYLLDGEQLDEFIEILAGSKYQDLAAQSYAIDHIRLSSSAGRLSGKRYVIGFMIVVVLLVLTIIFGIDHYLGGLGIQSMEHQ